MNKFLDLAVDIAFGVIAWLAVLAFSQLFSSWYLLRSDQALLGLFEVLLVIGVISPIAIGTALGRVLRSGNPYMWWVVVAGIGVLVAAVAVVAACSSVTWATSGKASRSPAEISASAASSASASACWSPR